MHVERSGAERCGCNATTQAEQRYHRQRQLMQSHSSAAAAADAVCSHVLSDTRASSFGAETADVARRTAFLIGRLSFLTLT